MGTKLSQIKILSKAELYNVFGLNVLRFSKDKRVKSRATLLLAVYCFLAVMIMFYVGSLSLGLCLLSLSEAVPAYLLAVASFFLFFLGIFKAGGVVFKKEGYDIISSLPVSQSAIVVSRFLRLYIEDLLFALAVLLPGLSVYAFFEKPGAIFFLFGLLAVLLVPVLPIVGAVFVGALVTAAASRMRYKSLAVSGLSILSVLAIMAGISRLSATSEFSPEMWKELSDVIFSVLEKMYPPAVFLGRAMVDMDFGRLLLCVIFFALAFGVAAALVSSCFHGICRSLYGTSAKHNYQFEETRSESLLKALVKRELKRYFSSGIYVTNTIIGPVMGVIFAGSVFVTGMDRVTALFPVPVDMGSYIPFVLAGIFCMMNATCVSVSMEGKNWWIINSLPLSVKNILNAKILMNLILATPFYLVSEILLTLALRPAFLELVWLILIPAAAVLFSSVFGLAVNLHFPVFIWESETSVVKQSASSLLGGLGSILPVILSAAAVAALPAVNPHVVKAVCCAAFLLAAALLYRNNNRIDLKELQ